jgi:cytochrome c556
LPASLATLRPPLAWLTRAFPGLAAAGLLAVTLLGCREGGPEEQRVPAPPRDLALLELMLQVNALHRGMEPVLRSPAHLSDLASAARGIASLAAQPLFVEWPSRPDFSRNRERFEALRAHLQQSAEDAAAAAESGDRDALHRFYAQMDGSCVACHKRYLETY